ncbi:cytochrome P450 [Flagelloscypha sp. PMI_526]|nr:cytochrome P450 [Flagelloscypha sp. PMI_526]
MSSPLLFGLGGILFHLVIFNFDIDSHIVPLISALLTAWISYTLSLLTVSGWLFTDAIIHSILVAVSFNTGLWTSITLYRLFFHRTRAFPGPWKAKLSRFYAVQIHRDGLQMHLKMKELHHQYGDFVRIGPREVSINKSSAISIIHGPTSKCTKSAWYSKSRGKPGETSLLNTLEPAEHRRRKRAWDRALSLQAISTYEPRTAAKTNSFITELRKRSKSSEPIDMTAWTSFLALDIMGAVGLGQDFQSVEKGEAHPVGKFISKTGPNITVFGAIPWSIRLLAMLPGKASAGYLALFGFASGQVKEKQRSLDATSKPQDVLSWLVKARFEMDKSAASEKALHEDSRLLILAGSDTTSSVLANLVYYLTANPHVLRNLQQELDSVFPQSESSWNYDSIKRIRLLDWIIHETLRLAPSVPSHLYRETPKEGITVDGVYIPGDTVVSTPLYLIHRDPRYWEDAEKFKPERWEGISHGPESSKEGYAPFLRGLYSCPGKHLAWLELKMAISQLALNFDFEFASDEAADYFARNQKDAFALLVPSLMMRLKERTSRGH